MSEMIERVATAIFEVMDIADSLAYPEAERYARAAIKAMEKHEDDSFALEYTKANGEMDYEWMARVLSGRLRQMDKRARATNSRADLLESILKAQKDVVK